MKKITLLFLSVLFASASFSQQTFYGSGGPIPDLTTVQYPIYVSGLPANINNVYGLENVCIDISHTYDDDITIQLKSPDGNTFMLSDRNGGAGDNYSGTCFRGNGAGGPVSVGAAPFANTYMPDINLATVNNGQNPNGTWWLIVADLAGQDTGNVNSMTIRFGNNPTPANPASSLPCGVNNPLNCLCLESEQTDCDLLPDMTASAMIIQQQHTEYGGATPHITLANATPNIGRGPMEIHGTNQCYCDTVQVPCSTPICPDGITYPRQLLNQTIYHRSPSSPSLTTWNRPGGTMTYHPTHGHVHVDNWAWFTLRHATPNPDARTWPIHGTGSKTAFCLVNLGNCTNSFGYCIDNNDTLSMADIPNSPFGMVTGCGNDQGIYVGNLDIYSEGLNGMGIEFPITTCNGDYYIVSITDPDDNFLESNEDNNWVAVPITLTLQSTGVWPTPGMSYISYGLTYDFINTSADFDSVYWDFGDGNTTMTTADTTTHIYTGDGIYIVTLIAYNQCGPRFIQDTLNIITTGTNTPTEAPFNISAYPNPFDNSTRIKYYLAAESEITLEVFNSIGQKVETLFSGKQLPGRYEFSFGGDDAKAGNGVYHIRLTSPSDVSTLRLVKIR